MAATVCISLKSHFHSAQLANDSSRSHCVRKGANFLTYSTGETPSDFDGADETSNSGSRTFPLPSNDGGDDHFQQQYQLPSSATAAAEVLAAAAAALTKRPAECVCPNCQRNMAASRFAPHLEKCMGMGRNSSRLASRRIASSATRQVLKNKI